VVGDPLGWVLAEKEQLAATIQRCFRNGERAPRLPGSATWSSRC
jgi:hypothetical protein